MCHLGILRHFRRLVLAACATHKMLIASVAAGVAAKFVLPAKTASRERPPVRAAARAETP
jgi:hypothetical protein